jgi:hypothetical protein
MNLSCPYRTTSDEFSYFAFPGIIFWKIGDVTKPQPAAAALVLVDLNLQFI